MICAPLPCASRTRSVTRATLAATSSVNAVCRAATVTMAAHLTAPAPSPQATPLRQPPRNLERGRRSDARLLLRAAVEAAAADHDFLAGEADRAAAREHRGDRVDRVGVGVGAVGRDDDDRV